MKRVGRHIPAYIQIAGLWPQIAYTYRFGNAVDLFSLLLKVYLLKMVFTAVYAGRDTVDGIPLRQVITVITLANLQLWLMSPMIASLIQQRVRTGQLALDLARPVPFLGQLLAHQIGSTVAALPFVLLALPFALALGGLGLPAAGAAGLLYLISLLLGYGIMVLMGLLLGLLAFWILEISGLRIIYDFANQFFAGALVPLWFFPPALRSVAGLLPFQAQTFIPLALYTGQIPSNRAVAALGQQLFWLIALSGVAWLLWRRAQHRIVIQGG
ncbi:MAG: ABC transporter permease [Roseiflexaceae bacterium]